MSLFTIPVGTRVRVKPCTEWVDPAARDIVGKEGVVVANNGPDYLDVQIDGDLWLLIPDEVEVVS